MIAPRADYEFCRRLFLAAASRLADAAHGGYILRRGSARQRGAVNVAVRRGIAAQSLTSR